MKYYYLNIFYSNLEELFVVLSRDRLALKLIIVSTNPSENAEIIRTLTSKLGSQIDSVIEFDPSSQNVQQVISDLYPGIGADRVAKLLGSVGLFPESNILLVDFGTAMTASLLDARNKFLGGYITLGFRTSLKALGDYCYQLEDHSHLHNYDLNISLGHSPENAIVQGTNLQMISYIEALKAKASEVFMGQEFISICTGGDAGIFVKYFDHHIDDIKLLSMFAKSL